MVSDEQQTIKQYQHVVSCVRQEMQKVMVGQEHVIDQLLWAVFGTGHALLEGVPGLGKTLLVRTLADALDLSFQRIQFTPDLMPADILGTQIIQVDEQGRQYFEFQHGPIFGNIVLADEINRATPKTQSALLEAMQEKTVSAGGETRPLPAPFFVLATQNPLEQEGTYPLPEAQMDRFLLKIDVPFPSETELKEIVQRTMLSSASVVEQVADGTAIEHIQQTIDDVLVGEQVLDYAVQLLVATHPHKSGVSSVKQYIRTGAGPRGVQAMIRLAKVRAFQEGRMNVSITDIQTVAYPALRHRLLVNFEGEASGIAADELLADIIEAVAVPS